MKQFDFLKTKPNFRKKDNKKDILYYDFETEFESCSIGICYEAGYPLIWMYFTDKIEMGYESTTLKGLEKQAPWFYEIVREANASLEKRDKLRRLFI